MKVEGPWLGRALFVYPSCRHIISLEQIERPSYLPNFLTRSARRQMSHIRGKLNDTYILTQTQNRWVDPHMTQHNEQKRHPQRAWLLESAQLYPQ